MKTAVKQLGIILGIVVCVSVATWFLLNQIMPKTQDATRTTQDVTQTYKSKVDYVALGDSLTEGIGDQTKQGGYVSILTDNLKEDYPTVTFTDQNAGVAGQRSDQILARVTKDEALQEALKQADFITMTFGGNDLMKVIQQNLFSLSAKKVKAAQAAYQEQVQALLTKIRELNPQAPVYVLGIYNPFYLNFSNIEEMQTIVDNWNDATKETVAEQEKMYFIPINELIYKGTNAQTLQTDESLSEKPSDELSSSDLQEVVENNVLSESDKFHPNKLGYQLIEKALKKKIIATKDEWLLKE